MERISTHTGGTNPLASPPFANTTGWCQVGFAQDQNRRFRRTMEDAHCIQIDLEGGGGGTVESVKDDSTSTTTTPSTTTTTSSSLFMAIFDGHAGKQVAELCGKELSGIFRQLLQSTSTTATSVAELLNQTFCLMDERIKRLESCFSGCTAIVAFIRVEARGRVLYTANVGDARAVLCRDGRAVRLSYDHKGSDANEARRIIESGGFMVNNRVNGVLAVTRAIGDMTMKEWVVGNPYTTETELNEEQDTFLILACDGLWDVCADQTAVDLVKDTLSQPKQDEDSSGTRAQKAADVLLREALDRNSTDNLSVMVVHFTV